MDGLGPVERDDPCDAFAPPRPEAVLILAGTLAARLSGAASGMQAGDLCAGAGGKTLALAAAMDIRGALIAADTDRARLQRLAPRAERAGAGMIESRLLDPGREMERLGDLAGRADAVLVDAPFMGLVWTRP